MAAETTSAPVRVPGPGAIAGLAWQLRQLRRSLILWSLAVAAVSATYAGFWAAMGDPAEFEALIDGMPEGLVTALGYDAIGTPSGYLESTVFGLLGPVLLLVFGITHGARLLAGREEEGELELELSLPVSRRRVLTERAIALLLGLLLLATVVCVVVSAVVVAIDMDVATGGIVAAALGLFLLAAAVGLVSFAAGAVTGRRTVGLSVGSGLAVAAFMADALAPLMEGGDWLASMSPFWWYLGGEPLTEGVDLGGYGLLLLLGVAALGVALVRFDRRDLGV